MARANKTSGGSRPNTLYLVMIVVALLGVGGLAYAILKGGDTATAPVEVEGLDDPQALVARAEGVTLGDPNAPLKLVEFGDYQCPACKMFALQVKPVLMEKYIDIGKLQLVYYDFPLSGHPHSFIAARAVRCAGAQERFWDYHDFIFSRQDTWSPKANVVDDFVDYAGEVGLDEAQFESCLKSDQFAEMVSANLRLGEQLGVTGTPTVILNGRNVPDWRPSELTALIDRELGAAQ